MTTAQLDTLPPGTILFLPLPTDVQILVFSGRVHDSDYYIMSSASDSNGTLISKRPVYYHPLDLLSVSLSEKEAWQAVQRGLLEKSEWISKKLETL